jgi:hypothetical protein
VVVEGVIGGAIEGMTAGREEDPQVGGEEAEDEQARQDGAQGLLLGDPDDRHGAVEGGLADLLLVLVDVGVGAHVAVVILDDERGRADLHAQVAEDAAVLDPDPAQAHGGSDRDFRGRGEAEGPRTRSMMEASGAACKRFPAAA